MSRSARRTSTTPGRSTSTSRSSGAIARPGSWSTRPASRSAPRRPADYREEKIDLPPSWLRGFMQVQAAMSLPMRRVPISREGLYNVLAFLKRHRAARSPRAVRFELRPGRPVAIVLEPWEKRIVLHDEPLCRPEVGDRSASGAATGSRLLARLLALARRGRGLPARHRPAQLLVDPDGRDAALARASPGWTANDWTGPSALDQLAPPAEPSDDLLGDIAATFRDTSDAHVRRDPRSAPARPPPSWPPA